MRTLATRAFSLPALGAALLAGCTKEGGPGPIMPAAVGTLAVNVENFVGPDTLKLDSRIYRSPMGEEFNVTTFNYYLSNFRLHRADGSSYGVPESYFLVRELRPGSPWPSDGKHIVLRDIPVGDYTGISFLIGVDEERNTAGAQTGALSPDNYMFWTWKQGYIFLQMEGTSPQSGETGTHMLSYHVGDFSNPNNIREVAPALPGGARIRVQGNRAPSLRLRADLLRLFVGAAPEMSNPVQFGPFWWATGGREAGRIATNYSGSGFREIAGTNSMFTVRDVRDN